MSVSWTYENAAHLLRRAGFGETPQQVDRAVKRGFEKTLARVLKPSPKTPKLPKKVDGLSDAQLWWLRLMLRNKRPLTDKLTLFWHNHFATAISKVGSVGRMHRHLTAIRANALGRFRDLVGAVAYDPAMLIWLDNATNHADSGNENFARELMELFTTGVLDANGDANYTETDVVEVARAFTGYTLVHDEFEFRPDLHDDGVKTIKGQTGNFDGDDVLDMLASDPATSRRIPARLFSWLAHPIDLDDPIAVELDAVYVATGGDILALVEAIFRHDAFYSPEARVGHVKEPAEWLVGTLRSLRVKAKGGPKTKPSLAWKLQDLGQSLLNPPSVFGWPQGLEWVGTSGLLERAQVADWIMEQRDKKDPIKLRPSRLLGGKKSWKDMGASEVVATVLSALGVDNPSPSTVSALETYVAQDGSGDPQPVEVDDEFVDSKVRGLVALICASPEFQFA